MCFDALVPYDTITVVIRRRQPRGTVALAGGAFIASVDKEIAALHTVPRTALNADVRKLRTRVEVRKGVYGQRAVAPAAEVRGVAVAVD